MILIGLSGIVNSLLMVRSQTFGKAVGIVGLVISIGGLGFLFPVIGPLLSLIATVGGIVWYLQLARIFYRLGGERAG